MENTIPLPHQSLSQTLNQTEESKQLLVTAKTMLEALQQAIDLLKDTQLSETELSPTPSMEATPPPRDLQDARRDTRDTVMVSEMSERVQYVYVHVYVYMYSTCMYMYMCM